MSQNLQNFAKFQKFQLENLVDFEKCCKTHILLQKSVPIQPKTSNILPKICQPTRRSRGRRCLSTPWRRARGGPGARPRRGGQRASVGKISAKCCSFSAVSAPIFARKYAFCSIFQNLPDFLAENFESWRIFANFATFAKCLLNFHRNC